MNVCEFDPSGDEPKLFFPGYVFAPYRLQAAVLVLSEEMHREQNAKAWECFAAMQAGDPSPWDLRVNYREFLKAVAVVR